MRAGCLLQHTIEMVLSVHFPSAMRVAASLQELHARRPSQVSTVAEMVEESLQAYGRCLIAVTQKEGGDVSRQAANRSATEAGNHMLWRQRAREAIGALHVDANQDDEDALTRAQRALDDLCYTLDCVMTRLGVRCPALVSGVVS